MNALFIFIIALTNSFASSIHQESSVTKSFLFHKKAPNTTPNSLKKTNAVNLSKGVLSLTTYSYFDSMSKRREDGIRLKKVREQYTIRYKKFLNSKSLTKNLYNLCWSNPCKNSAKCYGSVSKFKCICEENWTGSTCEEKKVENTCDQAVCNNNGLCEVMPDKRKFCKCFAPFYGFKCEKQFITITRASEVNTEIFNYKYLPGYKEMFKNTTLPSFNN